MSAQAAPAPDRERLRRLDAMGVRVYRLRPAPGERAAAALQQPASEDAGQQGVRLLIVCDEQRSPALDAIVRAIGLPEPQLGWCAPRGGRLEGLDLDAGAYLVLGQHLARALGAELPTEQQQRAGVTVVSAPSELRGNAMAKRLLWQALRPLKRRLGKR